MSIKSTYTPPKKRVWIKYFQMCVSCNSFSYFRKCNTYIYSINDKIKDVEEACEEKKGKINKIK